MKASAVLILSLCAVAQSVRFQETDKSESDGGIGKVVSMLKDMLKESKGDWEKDQKAYKKFKKYCDDNEEEKTESVAEATKTISLLGNKIEALQGSTGGLSVKVGALKADMDENEQAREEAEELRKKEKKAFEEEKKDLEDAMKQMDDAIKELAKVGADQTLGKNADNEKFMAGYKEKSLVSIQASVRKALLAASSFLEPEQQKHVTAFVQAPFTGTYTSQSAQIIGILKNMKDTFKSNLDTAEANEKKAKEAHEKFIKNKKEAFDDMKKSYDDKQATLGKNDGDLSSKKTQLQESSKQKEEDEDFLSKLDVQCTDKTEQYEVRKKFALNEQVALSKAIALLDNGVAAEKFGAVDATKFIQLSAVRHRSNARAEATQLLKKAAKGKYSGHVGKVLLLLQAGNPFTIILGQIDKMVERIDEEQKVDDAEKEWCEKTEKEQKDSLDDKKDELKTTQDDIKKLDADINDPKSGLKFQIQEAKDSLKENLENQGKETKTRREENLEYQKDARTMADAVDMITQAEQVLNDYYSTLDNEELGLIQTKADPEPPKTFKGNYEGQNENAKKVLKLLDGLKEDTVKEANTAHDDERKSQHDYEDSMKELTKTEAELKETLAKLNKDLATKEKDLQFKYEDETVQEKEKIAIERYIEKIEPGCKFITGKFDDRKTARKAEKKALEGAKKKLKGSPSYKLATQKAKEGAMGECKDTCLKDGGDAKCKACLAGVSVPGYCAGHKGAKGC
jgi:hypothetical protein